MNKHDPLSPDERELARLLRPDVDAEPSAELDARILAMARQTAPIRSAGAPAAAVTHPGRRRRRLTSSLAAVASLVLVVGLAWQLLPPASQPDTQDVSSEPSPASAAVSPPAATDVEAAPVPAPPAATAPLPRQQQASQPAMAPGRPKSERDNASANTGAPISNSRAAPAMARRAAIPASPPAPADAPLPVDQTDAPSETAARMRAAPAAANAMAPERLPTVSSPPEKMAAKAAAAAAMSSRVAPDIEADTALPRRQWLERIRERRDLDDLEGARASLQRFVLEHPKTSIPSDLRPLLEE